jgi:hypothetical protein
MRSEIEILENADFKNLYRGTGVTPQEWIDLQRLWDRRRKEKLFHTGEINVYSCLCRSPWCPKCAKTCQTAQKIRERLQSLEWNRVRQVILTVSRDKPPQDIMKEIRKERAIPKTVARLGLKGKKWLWVLEFHKGGFPHWHLFIETRPGKEGIIGKKRIQSAWKYGHVWETYAKSVEHWKAITGYHKKTGYFGAETKQHQLELPGYLRKENRVRKFASNFLTKEENEGKKTIIKKQSNEAETKKRSKAKSYDERLSNCDKTCKVSKAGSWIDVALPGSQVRKMAKEELEEIDYKTYRATKNETIDFISKLP